MAFPSSLNFMIGKLEATPGTAVAVGSNDFDVRVINPQLTLGLEVDEEGSRYSRGDHAEAESVSGVRQGTIAFDVRLAWGGTVQTEPTLNKYLHTCGLSSITYSDVGIGLQPLKVGDETTCTLAFYQVSRGATPTAIKTTLAGCCGTIQITAEKVGAPILLKFSFKGKLSGMPETIVSADIPVPINISLEHPEKFINNTLYIDGVANKIGTFTLDTGNDVQPVSDQSDPTGISHFGIVGRAPRFSCDPLVQALSVDNPVNKIAAATGLMDSDRIVLSTGHYKIIAPRAQLLPPALAAREGLEGWNKSYKLMGNGVTGSLGDTGLPAEATFELLCGLHETGVNFYA